MRPTRRTFLQASALGLTGALLGFRAAHASGAPPAPGKGFGPLVPDPDGVFDLPAGWRYRVISRVGERMDDGLLLPGLPDGMAAFPGPKGHALLVRNHELSAGHARLGPFGRDNAALRDLDRALLYDFGGGRRPGQGGTSTLLFDTKAQRTVGQRLSLAGTLRNCAGGATPWGTWITCEETTQRASPPFERDHGYAFEVPAQWPPKLSPPRPLTAMGRFNREAVAIDPRTGVVYQTEDRLNGLLYRFLPNTPGRLHEGGRLQALALTDAGADLRNWRSPHLAPGARLATRWIDLDTPEAPDDDLRLRGHAQGAARLARGEGVIFGDGQLFIMCTEGGRARRGHIWQYTPSPHEGQPTEAGAPGAITLLMEPNDPGAFDRGDNLTLAPWGDLVVCEDGSAPQHLWGVTRAGALYPMGRNALSKSELTGVTFAPDGSTLFVNIQADGLTLAITGFAGRG